MPEVEFRYAVFISFFNHHNNALYLERGYENALIYSFNWGIRTLATPLYQGGWWGTREQGLSALDRACMRYAEVDVTLYESPQARAP
ncbi:hypothetical protein [Hyalangium rubrum]|uniref:Uncharacterized protein n=1 Tax=Hyalangium rubrum TaxID=3103134 RepID=A0ABU5HJ26_9BACT|nr:hypothetical protein [Hyalangium sp. s54d21]MDY7232827.1 hypothetical protein [Hyalangium sp. s54d21]